VVLSQQQTTNIKQLYGMCYMTHKGTSHHLRVTTHKLLRWHSL